MILTINNTIRIGDSSQLRVLPGIKGLNRPKSNPVLYALPKDNRSLVSSNLISKRDIQLHCRILGSDLDDYYYLRQQIENYTYDGANLIPFTLTTVETLANIYSGKGLINITNPIPQLGYSDFSIDILCPDINFYGSNPINQSINFNQAGIRIPFLIPALIGSDSSNNLVINNTGNIAVYATVTIFGAGQNFTIWNQTTNKTSQLGNSLYPYALGDMQTVTISSPKVTENGVYNRYNYLSTFEALKLVSGSNTLTFTVESLNNSNTKAVVTFTPAFDHI